MSEWVSEWASEWVSLSILSAVNRRKIIIIEAKHVIKSQVKVWLTVPVVLSFCLTRIGGKWNWSAWTAKVEVWKAEFLMTDETGTVLYADYFTSKVGTSWWLTVFSRGHHNFCTPKRGERKEENKKKKKPEEEKQAVGSRENIPYQPSIRCSPPKRQLLIFRQTC